MSLSSFFGSLLRSMRTLLDLFIRSRQHVRWNRQAEISSGMGFHSHGTSEPRVAAAATPKNSRGILGCILTRWYYS